MKNRSTDLDAALAFVVGRVEDEAMRSGVSLNDEARYLLNHLPTTPTETHLWRDPELPDLPLRDFTYEKLCALTKAARLYDSQMRPEAETEWEFAAAVLKLNRHPMSWLLRWAGLKDENEKRPWWDRWLLVGTALMAVLLFVGGGVVVAIIAEGHSELWERLVWAAAGCCYAAAAVGVYFFIRRIENGQAKQRVERCRRNLTHSGVISHFPGSEGAPS